MFKMNTKRLFSWVLIISCTVTFSACGYFIYPERRGQTQGEIDPPILILDCAALVLFIIPGAIALAIDFTSGAVYLPKNKKRSSLNTIYVDNRSAQDPSYLNSLISHHTGEEVRLDADSVVQVGVSNASQTQVNEMLEYLNAHINDRRVLKQFADSVQNS